MAQVKNVPAPAPHRIEHAPRLSLDFFKRREQRNRVQIALHADLVAQAIPRDIEIHAPIDADDIAPGFFQQFENPRGAGAKVDQRGVCVLFDQRDGFLRMGQGVFAVIGGAQRADPTVKHLQGLGACIGLREQGIGDSRGHEIHQAMPLFWIAVHQPLGDFVIARRTAFYRIADQRERRARKADEGYAALEFCDSRPNGVAGVGHGFFRWFCGQRIDVCPRANGVVDDRPRAFDVVQFQTHGFENGQQILKNDRRVHVVGVHRLHGNGRGHLGRFHHVEKIVAVAIRPIRLHIPPGLAHEPHGRGIHGFPTTRFQKTI